MLGSFQFFFLYEEFISLIRTINNKNPWIDLTYAHSYYLRNKRIIQFIHFHILTFKTIIFYFQRIPTSLIQNSLQLKLIENQSA